MKRLLAALALWTLLTAGAWAQCVPPGGGPATIMSCPTAPSSFGSTDTDYLLGMQGYNGTTVLQVPGKTVKVQALQFAQAGGGGSGGGSSAFGSPFPTTGTAIGVQFGANMVGLKADLNGSLLVAPQGTISNGSDGIAPSSANISSISFPYGFNGATWDRLRVDGSKNLLVSLATTLPAGSIVNIKGAAGGILDAVGQNAASPANSLLIAGQFNTSPTTLTSGNVSPIQLDSGGRQLVQAFQASGSNFHIVCDSGCSTSTAPADKTAFTAGTTSQSPIGGFFQTTATSNPLTTGQMGAVQLTATRAFFTNLRDSSGVELGVAGAPLQVSLANTAANAVPVAVSLAANQSVNIAQMNGVAVLMGAGATGTGAQRVTVSQDVTTLAGSAPGTAGSASTNVLSVQGIASMTPLTVAQPTGTNLHVVCDTGCTSSSAPADASAFTFSTTSQTPVGGVFQTTATNNALTNSQMGAFQVTANRALFVNLRDTAGAAFGTTANPISVSLGNNSGANLQPVTTQLAAATAGGLSMFREIVPANITSVAVKPSAGQLYSIDAFSFSATTPAYIRFYNAAQGSVTCGSGTPTFGPYPIVASGGSLGSGFVMHDPTGFAFSTAITACITAGSIADNDTTAPAASTYVVNIGYK